MTIELIESLDKDVEELSRTRAHPREREAEVTRLRNTVESNVTLVESLQKELAELRESGGQAGDESGAALVARLREKEKAVAILSNALRRRELEVATLNNEMVRLQGQYSELEGQYVSDNPTAKVKHLGDKELSQPLD